PELLGTRCADFVCLTSATDAPAWCLRKSHKSQSSFGTNVFVARSHLGGSSWFSFSRKGRSGFCGGSSSSCLSSEIPGQPNRSRYCPKPKPSKKCSPPTSGIYHRLGLAFLFSLMGT